MKSTLITLVFAGVLVAWLAGCDGFLDLEPPSDANVNNFYQSQNDIYNAVNAVYGGFQWDNRWGGWQNTTLYMGDIRSDAGTEWGDGSGYNGLNAFENNPEADIPINFWNDAYEGILHANTVIERAGDVDMDDALRQRYIGEMKFLRALWYFGLVRVFGGVPVVTEPLTKEAAYELGRPSADAVYQQIEQDLNDAAAVLPWNYAETLDDDFGRATKGAAHALLGKAYMQWAGYKLNHETGQVEKGDPGRYQDAIEQFEAVINSGEYAFEPSYEDLWGIEDELNSEFIFQVAQAGGNIGEGSFIWNTMAPRGSGDAVIPLGEGAGRNIPTQWLIDHFEAGDLRKAFTHDYYTRLTSEGVVDTVDQPYSTKFEAPLDVENDAGVDFPVLRYTDILLLYAEALSEVNNGPTPAAYEILNRVRERAGLQPVPQNLTKQEFALALEQERMIDLAYEHHRFFDLVRTGRAVEVINEHFDYMGESFRIDENDLLVPIPQRVIDVMPMQQNPGW